jgi:hypothetical protein
MNLVDKRDKLQSKLFQKKLEKLIFLAMCKESHEMQNSQDFYDQTMHSIIWQPEIYAEMVAMEQKINQNNTNFQFC